MLPAVHEQWKECLLQLISSQLFDGGVWDANGLDRGTCVVRGDKARDGTANTTHSTLLDA